ncbi:Uncharacterised protein [Burkholderia pseudomallei]|nr:Uncharacterised protein [Burkholderia pseudomallei]
MLGNGVGGHRIIMRLFNGFLNEFKSKRDFAYFDEAARVVKAILVELIETRSEITAWAGGEASHERFDGERPAPAVAASPMFDIA